MDRNQREWAETQKTWDERYWEQVLKESRELLERQNDAIKTKQASIASFIRYHFLFLGFLFTIASFDPSGSAQIESWQVLLASMPSLAGILYSSHGHRSLGSYNIGLNSLAFSKVQSESKDYAEALKILSRHYQKAADENKTKLEDHDKYRFMNLMLLAVGFGMLIATIMAY